MSSDTTTIIFAVVVAIVIIMLYLVIDHIIRKQQRAKELQQRIAGEQATTTVDMDAGEEALEIDTKMSPTGEMLAGFLLLVGCNVEKKAEELRPKLHLAGIMSPDAPAYYLFFQRFISIFFILAAFYFFGKDAEGSKKLLNILVGVIVAAIGIFGAHLYVENAIQKRKKTLMRSFPDALDLILVCVESGLAMDAALGRVCKELGRAHPEITKELNRTRLELALLNDRTRALNNLAERTDLVPFRSLVAALIQTEKFGTSLVDTLRVLSDDYRQTRLMVAENKANRLPALITIPLILCLMPAFIMIIIGPSVVRVREQGGIFGGG